MLYLSIQSLLDSKTLDVQLSQRQLFWIFTTGWTCLCLSRLSFMHGLENFGIQMNITDRLLLCAGDHYCRKNEVIVISIERLYLPLFVVFFVE